MDAPECPLCGKKEWRHVCNPKGDIRSHPVVKIAALSPKPRLETNVKDFGAVGDGITDDRKALKRAGRPRLNRTKEEKRRMRVAYMKAYRAEQKKVRANS